MSLIDAMLPFVCEHFGIETNAPNYLAHWSTPGQIRESGERILSCAGQIIEACGN